MEVIEHTESSDPTSDGARALGIPGDLIRYVNDASLPYRLTCRAPWEPLLKKKELKPSGLHQTLLRCSHADEVIPDVKPLGRKGRDLMKAKC